MVATPSPPSPAKTRAITNAEYEEMIETATVDAYGESEQATGWHCVIDDHLQMPFETEMLGVTVRVEKIDLLDDDSIVAVCRRGHPRDDEAGLQPRVESPDSDQRGPAGSRCQVATGLRFGAPRTPVE